MLSKDTSRLFLIGFVIAVSLFILTLPTVQSNLAELLGLNNSQTSISKNQESITGVEKVTVDRVVDGDTIVLKDGRKVRYLNIDTPETVKENTPIRCYGKEASSFNRDVVSGKNILMVGDKEKQDKYGRELRFIFLQGTDTTKKELSINAIMVRKGFARASIIKPNDTFAQIFRDLEATARDQKLGVWGSCPKPFEE